MSEQWIATGDYGRPGGRRCSKSNKSPTGSRNAYGLSERSICSWSLTMKSHKPIPEGSGQSPAGMVNGGGGSAASGQVVEAVKESRCYNPEGQRARGPEGQRARGPEGQRARGPEGQRARGPEGQRARGPGWWRHGPEVLASPSRRGGKEQPPLLAGWCASWPDRRSISVSGPTAAGWRWRCVAVRCSACGPCAADQPQSDGAVWQDHLGGGSGGRGEVGSGSPVAQGSGGDEVSCDGGGDGHR